MFKNYGLLGIEHLEREEIEKILELAFFYKDCIRKNIKKLSALKGKSVVNLFYEPSTRTKNSFELAAKYLGANVINFTTQGSSVQKGETLKDTVSTLTAMGIDAVIIRHNVSGTPMYLKKYINLPVINAGDGMHEHPTQALLDMMTVMEYKGTLKDLKIAIIGDIAHSRVAKSNLIGFSKMGAKVFVAGPSTLVPEAAKKFGAIISYNVKEAVKEADVVMGLRLQLERQKKNLFPSTGEYAKYYGINSTVLNLAKPNVLLLHPGPVNREVELTSEVMDGEKSCIGEQVTNGVAIRMAVLNLLIGGNEYEKAV
ncbi:Aspartate carbamoyltransferase [Thermovenabulum gondwanense]|uniref:Aspartate carbamoyltransferase n=2 Tax=Thermovenabulum gondwanense TaxID=520767 RepID=A0A162M7I0_9FIRM|nr:aspartate carbamoyltransferase catalytic subunit [Thermovenabulum gondwanense]KYO64462.1 Aspartate carbamoyltransferase [Thermovenabulum gondwanense]